MSENICRIDRMPFASMELIHELTNVVREAAPLLTFDRLEAAIGGSVDQLNGHFKFKLSLHTQYQITLVLRKVALLAKQHAVFDLHEYSGMIIEFVQGDVNMDNMQQTSDMILRRVREALEKVTGSVSNVTKADVAIECTDRIVSDVFGNKPPVNPTYVGKYYEMDPETEDVLHNGNLLMNGMKVLIEDPSLRMRIHDRMTEEETSKARMMNRWATVTEFRQTNALKADAPMISFIALYEDGVKRRVDVLQAYAWIVRKDSIPRIDTLMTLEGHILERYPTAMMVEYLDHRVKVTPSFDPKQLKIQTGIDGDVISLQEYLVAEGVIDEEESGE